MEREKTELTFKKTYWQCHKNYEFLYRPIYTHLALFRLNWDLSLIGPCFETIAVSNQHKNIKKFFWERSSHNITETIIDR